MDRIVIDTMIFAYALLGVTDFCEDSLSVLKKAPQILAPDSLRAELVNVVWQWVSVRGVPVEAGIIVLKDANTLVTQFVSTQVLWERALVLALQANQAAYDTLFVALAERFGAKVVTYDQKLQQAFPTSVISPADFLARD